MIVKIIIEFFFKKMKLRKICFNDMEICTRLFQFIFLTIISSLFSPRVFFYKNYHLKINNRSLIIRDIFLSKDYCNFIDDYSNSFHFSVEFGASWVINRRRTLWLHSCSWWIVSVPRSRTSSPIRSSRLLTLRKMGAFFVISSSEYRDKFCNFFLERRIFRNFKNIFNNR